MRKTLLPIAMLIAFHYSYAQSQITTTGNNLIETSNPRAADIVIGSDAGIRHDGSIMWWSNNSASRISNSADVFFMSVWNTTNANVALNARLGGTSYFQGNLGVGTTNPGMKLSVVHTSGYGQIANFSSTLGDEQVGIGVESTGSSWIGTTTNHNFKIIANNTAMISVLANGNVGIGTDNLTNFTLSNANYKLAVAGNFIAEQATVKLKGNWPDYVFKPKYSLASLKDVKTYIDKNQHLPDMPSEQEVAKNGINLGEIVKLQTKKIEGLTLYLIDKDKQVNNLQSEVSQLKQQQENNKQQNTRIAALEAALSKLIPTK